MADLDSLETEVHLAPRYNQPQYIAHLIYMFFKGFVDHKRPVKLASNVFFTHIWSKKIHISFLEMTS